MLTTLETTPTRRRWQFLKEALSGTEQDFTTGGMTRGIALLAIPTVLEMTMESTFGLVDAFWVARLGANALAAVGLTEAMIVLVFAVSFGLATAGTATVARRTGEKDAEGASIAAVQAIVCGILIAIATGIVGALYSPQLLGLMNASPEVIRTGANFTRVTMGGSVTIILLFLINGVFRGSGDAALAMRTLWIANAINIALDPCFIYGWFGFPKMGVTGAAVATTIGRGVGVLFQLSVLFGGRARVKVARRHLRVDFGVMAKLLRLGSTVVMQYLVATASWMTLARINARFGSTAVAGYTIGMRIVMFALMPSWGICSAAATLVGQNLGAKQPERSERAVWLAGGYNMIFLTAVGALFYAFAGWVVGHFTSDAAVAEMAVACLKLVSLGYPFYAWGMVMEQAFNGAGDANTPMWINLFCY
jgi:putative MATE family efflux protein